MKLEIYSNFFTGNYAKIEKILSELFSYSRQLLSYGKRFTRRNYEKIVEFIPEEFVESIRKRKSFENFL